MDLVSGSIVLLFCVLGAAIALLADNLGRHLGKKKKTLGKLRPRHTATLFTCAAGFFIPLITVLLIAAVSGTARTILREGSQLERQRNQARRELEKAQQDLSSKLALLDAKTTELSQKNSQVGELTKKQKAVSEELVVKNSELATSKKVASGLRIESGSLKKQVNSVRAQVETVRKQASTLKRDFLKTKSEYQDLLGQRNTVQMQLASAGTELKATNAKSIELDLQARDLERQIKGKEKQITELQGREQAVRAEFKALEDTYKGLESTFERTKTEALAEIQQLQEEYEFLQRDVGALRELTQSARVQPMIFARFDELARVRVLPGVTVAEAKVHIESALRAARIVAKDRGAVTNASGQVASLVDIPIKNEVRTGEEQIEAAAIMMANSKVGTVVLVNALFNAFKDEAVPLILQVQNNPVIYRTGDVIAESKIDGTLTEEQIYNQLSAFLRDGLRRAAIKDKMVPAQGKDDMLGELTGERVLTLVREIKRGGRTIRVIVVAAKETRAADSLTIDFRFR